MKRVLLSIITIGLLVITGCNNVTVMTMTTEKEKVVLCMAGSGTFIIDWGNGLGSETYSLSKYDENAWNNWHKQYDFIHEYSNTSSSKTIIITGKNITHLKCYNNDLMSLDVSKNSALTYLWCNYNYLTNLNVNKNPVLQELDCENNQLTSLNLSKNTLLIGLNCSHNQLTSLDMSRNTKLTELMCKYNQLTSLDLSKNSALVLLLCNSNQLTSLDLGQNPALELLFCGNNQLTNSALNAIFNSLNDTAEDKTIVIINNPGESDCDRSIATTKSWTFREFSD